jgi:hypothetical protein
VQQRWVVIRGVLLIALSVALLIGAIAGNQVVLLLAVTALVVLLSWEFELRRRRRA